VTFEINADGIVSVRAKDLETGLEQSIQVTATSGLTREEIKNMMDNAKDDLVDGRTSEEFEATPVGGSSASAISHKTPSVNPARAALGQVNPRSFPSRPTLFY